MNAIESWAKALEIRDWISVAALMFSGLGLYLNWNTRRDIAKRQQKESDRAWSIERANYADELPFLMMRLEYREPHINPLVLESVKVLKPKGARLANYNNNRDYTGEVRDGEPSIIDVGAIIDVGRSMTGEIPGRGRAERSYFDFYLALPSRPHRFRRGQSKSVIKLTVSDMSRSRRTRTIAVTTPPMSWADTSNSSAT